MGSPWKKIYDLDETSILVIGCLLPVSALVIVLACLIVCLVIRKRRNTQKGGKQNYRNGTADYIVLKKDGSLKERLVDLAGDTAILNAEFKQLESFVKQEVVETTEESTKEVNTAHNRYNDVLPYDGKFITTRTTSGSPPTTYINASCIKFDHLEQSFITTQAPKPNSFQNFWQMILERKVSVIVMITGLTEGNLRKADQYWPDEEHKTKDLGNMVKLEHKETSYQGTYYHRTIEVHPRDGGSHTVSQLQITKWMDLTAPDHTKILLDLINKTKDLVGAKTDVPILVHCSAGVGRTGTCISVYKLMNDYFNTKVRKLDLFLTVLEMRRQRMKMVQKPSQYVYIIQCLKDVVRQEEVDYYDD